MPRRRTITATLSPEAFQWVSLRTLIKNRHMALIMGELIERAYRRSINQRKG